MWTVNHGIMVCVKKYDILKIQHIAVAGGISLIISCFQNIVLH